MNRLTTRTLMLTAVALVVVIGAGTALAATGGSAPTPSSFLDSLAKHLGVSREKLDDAARAAAVDQVDAALDAGTITKEQAAELRQRIASADVPLLGLGFGREMGHGLGHAHVFGGPGSLETAAEYLGLTEEALRSRLGDGETLAQIAKAEGKTVDGLKQALVADAKERLAEAVKDGRLTSAQSADLLERYTDGVDDLVNGTLRPGRDHRGLGPPLGMDGARGMRVTPGFFGVPPTEGAPA
jgi:hypothetical protein